jgi:hypothetical protein
VALLGAVVLVPVLLLPELAALAMADPPRAAAPIAATVVS